jgi:SAM-dependent methyltransferase
VEVGCGTGYWLAVLAHRGLIPSGLDASVEMLAHARQRVPQADVVFGDASHLPWESASFDKVFCIHAFHHFGEKHTFLAEARRVLRPQGGLLIIGLDPHLGTDQWSLYEYFDGTCEMDKQRYPATDDIRQWMVAAGFTRCTTSLVEHLQLRWRAREALAQGKLAKSTTSQLSVLTDVEYQQGIAKLEQAIAEAAGRQEDLFLMSDLHLYGTSGYVEE